MYVQYIVSYTGGILNMLSKFFTKIFKQNNTDDISTLNEISNGLGEYASCSFNESNIDIKYKKGQEMLSIITSIENNNIESSDTNLLYAIAIAYRNYCAWFVRANKKKKYLEKSILFLNKSISASSDNIDAKSELGKLLIEEKVIRDLSKGINIFEKLQDSNQMPEYLNSILSKAIRQNKGVNLENTYDLCSFNDPSPAVFREERKRFRELIRTFKKEKNIDNLKTTLNQYYQLAVLVTVCYGEHDCNSGVRGNQYDNAIKIVKNICKEIDYSYITHGKIENSNFISENDWKTFVKVFGDNTNNFNTNAII